MAKLKIKSGDTVRVIAGEHKGQEGKVQLVLIEKNKAIVEGVNMISKHEKIYNCSFTTHSHRHSCLAAPEIMNGTQGFKCSQRTIL